MNDVLLHASRLSKVYIDGPKKRNIFQGLNLTLKQGETYAVMGRSGCGKSSLLHVLAGLDQADDGVISIKGKFITTMTEQEISAFRNEHLGIVYQRHHLLYELNALENVALPLWLAGQDRLSALEQAQVLLSKVGLAGRSTDFPEELSGGQRQRVAIARALINQPAILLADEPTGNLDNETATLIVNLLSEIATSQQTTVFIVTHDPDVAKSMNHRWRMDQGTLHAF